MTKIIEAAMRDNLRRIENLEESVKFLLKQMQKNFNQNPDVKENFNPNAASPAQINYLRTLGGKTWEGMTKDQAGKQIDNALFEKKILIKEPTEVDTDDAGLDDEGLL